MKAKIIIILFVLLGFMFSCAIDRRNKKWRHERFVQQLKPAKKNGLKDIPLIEES